MPTVSSSDGPVRSIGWQPGVAGVPGLDWEVSRSTGRRWRAELICGTTSVTAVHSRWRPVLWLRMRLVQAVVGERLPRP